MFDTMYRWAHRWLPGLNYRQKIMLAILVFTLIPLLAGGIYGLTVYRHNKLEQQLEQVRSELGYAVDNANLLTYLSIQKSTYIKGNLDVLLFLRQDYSTDLVSFMNNFGGIKSIFDGMKSDRVNQMILLFGSNESLYRNEYIDRFDRLDPDVLQRLDRMSETMPLWVSAVDPKTKEIDIRLYGKIMDVNDLLGVLEMRINPAILKASLTFELPQRSFLAFQTSTGDYTIVTANGLSDGNLHPIVDGFLAKGAAPGYRVVAQRMKDIDSRALLFVSNGYVNRYDVPILVVGIAVLLFVLLTISFTVRQVSIVLTRRLARLMKRVGMDVTSAAFEREEAAVQPMLDSRDEFEMLASRFNELVVVVREHYRTQSRHELDQKLLEMKLLQISINPHFLYNTLSAIKWTYPDPKLQQLIEAMVKYYRLFLNSGESLIPVIKEIELLAVYMDIQKFAYDSDFTYRIEIQEELKAKSIIRNLLQPIVENAILHGINGLETGGRVVIRGRTVRSQIVFLIADNGVGIPRMQSTLKSGYGLENVKQRLRLYYGESADLTVRSRPGLGTVVKIEMPL